MYRCVAHKKYTVCTRRCACIIIITAQTSSPLRVTVMEILEQIRYTHFMLPPSLQVVIPPLAFFLTDNTFAFVGWEMQGRIYTEHLWEFNIVRYRGDSACKNVTRISRKLASWEKVSAILLTVETIIL